MLSTLRLTAILYARLLWQPKNVRAHRVSSNAPHRPCMRISATAQCHIQHAFCMHARVCGVPEATAANSMRFTCLLGHFVRSSAAAHLIKEVEGRWQRGLQRQQQRQRRQRLLAAAERPKRPPAVLVRPAQAEPCSRKPINLPMRPSCVLHCCSVQRAAPAPCT